MTKKDLRYKPRVAEKAKFEYSLMCKVFNKGLDEKDKKEGLLKRLRNIETKYEEQLKAIEDQGRKELQIRTGNTNKEVDLKNISFKSKLNCESTRIYNQIKDQNKMIDYAKLVCIGSGEQHHYNFTIFLGF